MKLQKLHKYTHEKVFWNNKDIVSYFNSKPPDPRIKERLLKMDRRVSKKALDIGCGAGRHTELLCQLGFITYACDINSEMIKATQLRVKNYYSDADRPKYILFGDMSNLPFNKDFFDLIISTGVLHQAHSFQEYELAIKELSRVLKRGGEIALNVFTNKVIDSTFKTITGEQYTVLTKEGLHMTLLPKKLFYELMRNNHLLLKEELSEDIKKENTGIRAVLRANFIKE